MKLSQFKPFK